MTKYNIDVSKLKRDYIKNPLKITHNGVKSETPYKEDLEYLYIGCNMTLNELVDYFKCNKTYITRLLKKFNIKKDISLIMSNIKTTKLERYGNEYYLNKEKRCQTNIEKYGNVCPIHNKDINDKMKLNNMKKYGTEYITQTNLFKQKAKETKLERYGEENYNNVEKIKETNLERYGVDNPSKLDAIKDKVRNTNLEKFGVEYVTQIHILPENLDIIKNKDKLKKFIIDNNIINANQLSDKLGINSSNAAKYIREYELKHLMDYSKSLPEKELKDYVNQYFKTENNIKILDGKEIDIFIPEKNIGIEFNGNYWHSEKIVDNVYQQNKSLLAESKGIFLYHIFEYEWMNKKDKIINQLNNLLGLNHIKIYARKCIIKEVNNIEKKEFLELNHMQGDDKSSIKLGLYYKNKLVSLMTFVKPRFNKNYEWELSRFCSKAGCNVIGGASKLFKYFIKTYKPSNIISYSNIAHTKGDLYEILGFTMLNVSKPNYIWCKGKKTLSRYQCQKHKLLEQGFEGNSENDIMYNRGYYRIYDCGNKVWVLNNK